MNFFQKRNVFLILYMLILWGMYGYGIERIYGFSVFQDEFGYWSNAAYLAGYDWSGCAGLFSYYSYGYSIPLAAILKVFPNSMAAYRAATAFNVFILCMTIILLWRIADSLFPELPENRKIYSIGAAIFYPVTTFYMQMTLTENLLAFLYVLVCYLVIRFYEEGKISTVAVLAVVLPYMFLVHMRTVGVMCACVIVLAWLGYRYPSRRKALFIGIAVMAVCMLLGMGVKGLLTDRVFGNASQETLAVNEAAGQIDKIKKLFSLEGIYYFLHSMLGKLFYLGMASWGTLYFTAAYCLRNFRKPIMQFIILSGTVQFFISAIYMMNPSRIDTVIYGRYNDYLLPIFIVIGIFEIMSCKYLFRKVLAVLAGNGIILLIIIHYMQQEELYTMKGYFAAGIGYLWKARKSWDTDINVAAEMGKAYLICAALIALLVLCVTMIRHFKNTEWILCVFICAEIVCSMVLNSRYTFLFNDVDREILKVYDFLQEHDKKQIYYINEDGFPYVDLIQFYVREPSIEVYQYDEGAEWKELLTQDGYLLVNADCTCLEEIEAAAEPCAQGGDLLLFDLEALK